MVEGNEVFLDASVGVALNTFGVDDTAELLSNAEAAMYQAKGRGGSGSTRDRALQVIRLGLHRAQRIEIVGLVPGAFHVRAGRHDIRQMHEASAVIVIHDHNLMVRGVAAGHADVQSGHQRGVAL